MGKDNKKKKSKNSDKKLNISDVIGSSIPKPPEPPKNRIIHEDGKGLVPPKNYR